MIYIGLALVFCFVGVLPLYFRSYRKAGTWLFVITGLFWSCIAWSETPTLMAYPLLGFFGMIAFINLIASAVIESLIDCFSLTCALPASVAAVVYFGFYVSASEMWNATAFRDLVGSVESRTWTQDVQPKDEKHLRLVSKGYALYKAKQALGEAGAIGSQFEIDSKRTTLQSIQNELWYIVPLDFTGYLVWKSQEEIPGYIRVHGEDPERPAEFVGREKGKGFRYSPEACFGNNLERHIRLNGYVNAIFADTQMELNDEQQPFWIISLAKATIGWSGEKITGILIVDPVTGNIEPKALSEIPAWVDRVFPAEYVTQYLKWYGEYIHGWWNSWNDKNDLQEPEDITIIYSSEQHPDFVTGMTSMSKEDTSLLGYVYTDTRTGKTVLYKVKGGSTDSAILKAVNANQDVQFKHLHGVAPQTYNISGIMASVVILENEQSMFQGIAIVDVMNNQNMGVGRNAVEVLQKFQALLAKTGKRVALNKEHDLQKIKGVIDRARSHVSGGESSYFLHIKDIPHLFTGGVGDFPSIFMIEPGDTVTIEFINSPKEVVSIHGLTNHSLILATTEAQVAVEQRSLELRNQEEAKTEAGTITESLKQLSPTEIQEVGRLLKQAKTKPKEKK